MERINQSGQTIIALLIFMMLAITITTTAVAVTIANSQANTSNNLGTVALTDAESAIEDSMELILRNPGYTATNKVVNYTYGSATISVSNSSGAITITSTGSYGSYSRKVVATATYANNALTLNSWTETP